MFLKKEGEPYSAPGLDIVAYKNSRSPACFFTWFYKSLLHPHDPGWSNPTKACLPSVTEGCVVPGAPTPEHVYTRGKQHILLLLQAEAEQRVKGENGTNAQEGKMSIQD